MNQKCYNLYGLHRTLEVQKKQYDDAYNIALAKGDFSDLKVLMFGLKTGIKELRDELIAMYLSQFPPKLREALTEENYNEALATAREFDPSIKAPSREVIIKKIAKFGAEKLANIDAVMGKPALIITPANQSLREMKERMDMHKYIDNQKDAFLADDDPWSEGKQYVGASIVDVEQYPELIPGRKGGDGSFLRNDEQLRVCEKYFRERGMRLIHDYEYAVAMQRSLRAYKKAKEEDDEDPEKYIPDYFGAPQVTFTVFYQEHNVMINKVAVGGFGPGDRGVRFGWDSPGFQDGFLRGRGAVQVI